MVSNNLIPKCFFITSGSAESNISKLNAFDRALMKAGIAQCNLVPVSSIIPVGAEKIEYREMPIGTITFVIMARIDGIRGEEISAGICWVKCSSNGMKYGLVAEGQGKMGEEDLKRELDKKVEDMVEARGVEILRKEYRIESLKISKKYGSAIAAVVFASP